MQLGSGPLRVNVSTSTGRLLALTSQAGLLSAELNSEVHHKHFAQREAICGRKRLHQRWLE